MSGGGGKIRETPEQKAMAARITAGMQDHFTRWRPLQNRAIQIIENVEPRRQQARNAANVGAQQAVGEGFKRASAGAPLGSGRQVADVHRVAAGGAALSAAGKAKGVSAVNDQYARGLTDVVGMGLRQKARADQTYQALADLSGKKAAADVAAKDAAAAGRGEALGSVVGAGAGLYLGKQAGLPNFDAEAAAAGR